MKKVWKTAIAGILAAMLCFGTACAGGGEGYQKFDDATFSADWAAALAEENFKNYKAVTTAEAEVGQGDAAQTLLSRMTIVIADGKGHVKEEDGWKNGPMETVMEGYADWSVSPSKGYLSEAGGDWVKDDSAQAETVCRANEQFIAIFRVNPDQFTYSEEKQGYEKKENANFTVDGEASEMGKQFSSVLLQFKDGKLARFVYQIQGTAALGMKETEVLFTYGGQSVVFPDFGIDDDEGGTHVGGEGSGGHTHEYTVENVCSTCGAKWEYTEGLTFEHGSTMDGIDEDDEPESGYSVIGSEGELSGDIVIPYGYEGEWVTSISECAFVREENITSVTVPESVKAIGGATFSGCTNLASVTLPGGLIALGGSAFENCASLQKIELPDSLQVLGPDAFLGTPLYENSANWNGDALYLGHHLLKVRETASGKFSVRKDTRSIAGYAFSECADLTEVELPDGLTQIASALFSDCTRLRTVNVPDSVTKIHDYAFQNCPNLASIHIPERVTVIDFHTFEGCSSLASIRIPDGVTEILGEAFSGCTQLAEIKIPANVTVIGEDAFLGTAYYNTASNWDGDLLYQGEWLLGAKDTISGNVTVQTGTKRIADGTFAECMNLKEVELPAGMISIGEAAFQSSSLTSITIPAGMISIGDSAFNSSSLTSITIPASVTSIGSYAFYECRSLTSIEFEIPSGWRVASPWVDKSATWDDPQTAAECLKSFEYAIYPWTRDEA